MFGLSKKETKKDDEDISQEEQEYIDSKKGTNPYGMIVFFMGGLSFMKGYTYVFIPIITIIFGIITYRTYDKEKEDNPFPFYIGILLALIGIFTFITHQAPIFA
jgi:hypothetical protein